MIKSLTFVVAGLQISYILTMKKTKDKVYVCANPACAREYTQDVGKGTPRKYCQRSCQKRGQAKATGVSRPHGELSPESVRELFDYDPETGILTHRPRPLRDWCAHTDKGWNTRCAGKKAGRLGKNGHWYIGVAYDVLYKTKNFMAHRVIWAHYHGQWPDRDIDHINGDPADNRIVNLRLCTETQNLANAKLRKDNTSGVKGVYWHKQSRKWYAFITIDKKVTYLGGFHNIEDAIAARQGMAAHVFGEFARETPLIEQEEVNVAACEYPPTATSS